MRVLKLKSCSYIILKQIRVVGLNSIIQYWNGYPFTGKSSFPGCFNVHVETVLGTPSLNKRKPIPYYYNFQTWKWKLEDEIYIHLTHWKSLFEFTQSNNDRCSDFLPREPCNMVIPGWSEGSIYLTLTNRCVWRIFVSRITEMGSPKE